MTPNTKDITASDYEGTIDIPAFNFKGTIHITAFDVHRHLRYKYIGF